MKKNNLLGNNLTEKVPIKHFLLIMRMTFILLFTCVLCSMAEISYTQNAAVTINKRNVALKEVLNEIEKQTNYLFIYNNEVNTNEKVTVNAKQKAVSEVLNSILKEKDLNYTLEGNHIILSVLEKIDETDNKIVEIIQQQQKKKITGTVFDVSGVPIIGANIVEAGTTNGTITDIDGNFSLNVEDKATINISYIGYLDQKINTTGKTYFSITLVEDTQTLDEVVVVGYGTQKKETITGSIVSVSSKELVQSPVSNISNQLVGRMTGLMAVQSSGEPGKDAASLKIRGIGTLDAGEGSDPIVVIDGVQSDASVLNQLDANEVETVNVLKDASATAVYGVRGANGVIIVTTKRGQVGKPQLSFTSNFGFTQLVRDIQPANSYETAIMRNEAIRNDNNGKFENIITDTDLWKLQNHQDYTEQELDQLKTQYKYTDAQIEKIKSFSLYYPDHNYFKELFRDFAPQHQYNFNVSGGTERIKYFTSVGYFYLSQSAMDAFAANETEAVRGHMATFIAVKHELFPIPAAEIDLNDMPQNSYFKKPLYNMHLNFHNKNV